MNKLSNCLYEESNAIRAAAAKLNSDEVDKALDVLENCSIKKSKVVISGVGKSGIVARKIAATFSSLGLMSLYLNPLDALHGDLGIVDSEDVCILLSNSGETQEILEVLPHLKRRGTTCIALVGRINSTLAKESNIVLDASVDKEVCPLNLAPTASTAVAMAIGDSLAAVITERFGISSTDFAINHPAGQLGKKLTLKVENIMIKSNNIRPINPDSSLQEVIYQLTNDAIGTCLVKDPNSEGRLLGIITDGDLRRALKENNNKNWDSLIAENIMTLDPICIEKNILIVDALKKMELNGRKPVSVLPVVNEDNLILGLLRLHDLIKSGLV